MVERLAQDGLLKIICGTDTLGVGVNVPIRSVLFTQLCKYDGTSVRILSNREFAQIAGRAGRKGFDDRGDAWVQAPPHVVENLRADEKAASSNSKKKPVKKKAPERGYAHWDEAVFDKLVGGAPEALRSHFSVTHQMVMSLLDRPVTTVRRADGTEIEVDGCGALRHLLVDNHETRRGDSAHTSVGRSRCTDRSPRRGSSSSSTNPTSSVAASVSPSTCTMTSRSTVPLSLWALSAVLDVADGRGPSAGDPDADDLTTALDVLTVIESVTETPGVVVAAQLDRVRDELMAEMKASGVEYEERMEKLAEAEPPRPNADWLYGGFNEFRRSHPWVGGDTVAPKSIAPGDVRAGDDVRRVHLALRAQAVRRACCSATCPTSTRVSSRRSPTTHASEDLDDVTAWLGALVRQVDSSLIDEWERLIAPDDERSRRRDRGGPTRPCRPGRAGNTHGRRRRARLSDHGPQRRVLVGREAWRPAGVPSTNCSDAHERARPASGTSTPRSSPGPTLELGAPSSRSTPATGEVRQIDPRSPRGRESGESSPASTSSSSAAEGRPMLVDARVESAI